jgi:hypothetical protein
LTAEVILQPSNNQRYNARMLQGDEKIRGWQFSIRHLLSLMTIIAVASVVPSILAGIVFVLAIRPCPSV